MQSVNRTLDVLFHLASVPDGASATEIARSVAIPRPTVYRILDTLGDRGLVSKIDLRFSVNGDEVRRLLGA